MSSFVLTRTTTRLIGFRSSGSGWSRRRAPTGSRCRWRFSDEIASSKGPLRDWTCGPEVRKALVLDEEADQDLLDAVLTEGYGADLTEVDLEKIGSDAF